MLKIKQNYDKCKEASDGSMCFFKIGKDYQVFEDDAEFLNNFADFEIGQLMGLSSVKVKSANLDRLLIKCVKLGQRVCVIENVDDDS